MKYGTKCILIAFIFIFIGSVGSAFIYISLHEQVHVQIFKSFGINSTVVHTGTHSYTVPTSSINLSHTDMKTMYMLHSFNEIFGYPLELIYIVMVIQTIILLIIFVEMVTMRED